MNLTGQGFQQHIQVVDRMDAQFMGLQTQVRSFGKILVGCGRPLSQPFLKIGQGTLKHGI